MVLDGGINRMVELADLFELVVDKHGNFEGLVEHCCLQFVLTVQSEMRRLVVLIREIH